MGRVEASQRGTQVEPLQHTPQQRAIVETQLGRSPRGRWRVARECHLGVPMVIETHPQGDDDEPFPTLYWLTCPVLNKRVSTLESEGAMADVNAHLATDATLKGRLSDAIDRYIGARDAHVVIADVGAPPGGGPDRVKCLHAHVAHELVDAGNPVGGLTLGATGWPDCVTACVEVPT